MDFPNAEILTVAWVKTIPNVPSTAVGTSLPGNNAAWATTGFVQVTSIPGGRGNIDTPLQNAQLQIDCWGNNPNSQKPAWGRAASLAQAVYLATFGYQPVPLTLPALLVPAGIASVYPLTEPSRVAGDESGFARFTFDLNIAWAVVPS